MLFTSLSLIIMLALAVQHFSFVARRKRLRSRTWEQILDRVLPLDIAGVNMVASTYLAPTKSQLQMCPSEMWLLVGQADGLRQLKKNADVMLELAVYAQRWDKEEAIIVAELIRRDAARVSRAVNVLGIFLLVNGTLDSCTSAPFHLLEATAAYSLLRGRLVSLYEKTRVDLVPQLCAAV